MRKIFFVLFVFLLFGSVISVLASEAKVQYGLGLGFSPNSASLNFPLNISQHFRLEPEIGFSSFTISRIDQTRSQSSSAVKIGCGFFYLKKYDSLNFYSGIRLGLILNQQKDTQESMSNKASSTDALIGPAIGAEYFFVKKFSLGGEFQFNYVKYGKATSCSSGVCFDVTAHDFNSKGLVFIRWYFN